MLGLCTALVVSVTTIGGTTANAWTTDSYTSKADVDGTHAYWDLTIGSEPDVGSGWCNATLTFAKGGTQVINAQYFYSAGRSKYYTAGSVTNCHTSKIVVMRSSMPGAVNIGAKTTGSSYVKYKDAKLTLDRRLKVGTPPTTTSGYLQR